MSFDCIKCGGCCRLLTRMPELSDYDRGDGTCRYLTDDNLCAIYETRPVVCRVDLMKPHALTDNYWHSANHEACSRIHLAVYGQPIPR